jgi:hypothetical protein
MHYAGINIEINIHQQEYGYKTIDYKGIVARVGEDDGWVVMNDTEMKITRTA